MLNKMGNKIEVGFRETWRRNGIFVCTGYQGKTCECIFLGFTYFLFLSAEGALGLLSFRLSKDMSYVGCILCRVHPM